MLLFLKIFGSVVWVFAWVMVTAGTISLGLKHDKPFLFIGGLLSFLLGITLEIFMLMQLVAR